MHFQTISDFISYLDDWKKKYPNSKFRLAPQTHLGLRVSLQNTLDLLKYLHEECNFEYLMTRRLNQDALEVQYILINY